MREFSRPFKGKKGDFGGLWRVGFGRKLGRKGLFLRQRRPLKPLCWPFSVLMGRCPPKGVRKPQRAGTETESEGVPKMWRQLRSTWNRGRRDDRGTELRKSGKVGGKSVKK